MVIGFTGHRPDKLGGYDWSTRKNEKIMYLISQAVLFIITKNANKVDSFKFITGGALGADQMAFSVCHDIKMKREEVIELEIAIPFKKFNDNWRDFTSLKVHYAQTKSADIVTYVDDLTNYKVKGSVIGEFDNKKYMMRNMYMVDNSDIMVSVWDGQKVEKSGTYNTIKYILSTGKTIINVNPRTLKLEIIKRDAA